MNVNLTDNLQLPSNHNRSFTMVILKGQNIFDILYVMEIIVFVVYNSKLKYYGIGLSYF